MIFDRKQMAHFFLKKKMCAKKCGTILKMKKSAPSNVTKFL